VTPIVDHHDCIFPGEWCHVASAWVFLEFATPGEGPQCREVLHHVTVLELMLDGVHMIWTGLLEKSLKVVSWWPHLVLATMHGSCNIPHVGAVCFLDTVIIVVSHDLNPLGAPITSLLSALGSSLGVFDGGGIWHHVAAARSRIPTTWDRVKFGCLLVGGVLDGDVAHLLSVVLRHVIQRSER
jgi:hypothetical protein